MALDPVEFSPSDGLWDLVGLAAERGAERFGEILVVSERERRADDPPEPDWAAFDTDVCASVDVARALARERLAPGGAWRAAVVWREGDRLLIEAQDAETDSLAGRFAVSSGGEPEFPEPVEPLRAPTWNGTTWTLRAKDRVVAELHVTSTNWHYLLADVTPRQGLEAILPESPYRQHPHGDWSLHKPDGSRVDARELELNREQAGWTWKGAFE